MSEWVRFADRCCTSVKSCETVIPTASSTAPPRSDENWVIATALHQNACGTLKQYSTSFEVGKLFLRRGPTVLQIIYMPPCLYISGVEQIFLRDFQDFSGTKE